MTKKHAIVLGATAAVNSRLLSDAGFEVVEEDMICESAAIEQELKRLRVREIEEERALRYHAFGNERRNKSDRKRNKAERWR